MQKADIYSLGAICYAIYKCSGRDNTNELIEPNFSHVHSVDKRQLLESLISADAKARPSIEELERRLD